MKLLLFVFAMCTAVSACAQNGLESKSDAGGAGSADKPATVWIEGADGSMRQIQVPTSLGQLKGLVDGAGSVDLQNFRTVQAGCPVQIVNASFERAPQLLLTGSQANDAGPSLHMGYRNSSGKEIASVAFTGWIKVKSNPYRLDSVSRPFMLELSPQTPRSEGEQVFKLIRNAIGFDRIELARVNYADGTSWQPRPQSCVFANSGTTERAEAR